VIMEASTETASESSIHLRFLSLSRARDLMFLRIGKGSMSCCREVQLVRTSNSSRIAAIVSAVRGSLGVGIGAIPKADPWASHQFWMSRRSVWLGTSSKDESFCMVAGHVWLPASSHGSMLLRS
jgi:hypothetical protein